MTKKRCIILIDGSNFFFKLKDLGLHNLMAFDFKAFNSLLARNDKIVSATYFVGKVRTDRTKKSKRMQADQQRVFNHLSKHGYRYTLGFLLKSDGKYHEKGVDVELAISILVAAYEDLADRIILVSSDTDLIPAIKKAQAKGKTVEYIGFSHKPSMALIAQCAKSRLLDRPDLESFVPKRKK